MKGYVAGFIVIAVFVMLAVQVRRDAGRMISFQDSCLSTGGITVVEYTRPGEPVCIPRSDFIGYKLGRREGPL